MDFAKKGLISLSRPISAFKGSEGKIINFAKRIQKKYEEQGIKIEPSDTDLKEIGEWIKAYEETYGDGFNKEDIDSESKIIFCGIIQAYCGYFTNIDLFNKRKLKNFLEKNKLKEKIGVIRLDLSVFDNNSWNTSNLQCPFTPYVGNPDSLEGFNGYTHLINITYTENFDDYRYLLRKYNENELRKASFWFDNIDIASEWQKEKRIIFLLNSLEINSRRIGCKNIYKPYLRNDDFAMHVFRNIVDVMVYWSKSPSYVYLNVNGKITFKTFKDILGK